MYLRSYAERRIRKAIKLIENSPVCLTEVLSKKVGDCLRFVPDQYIIDRIQMSDMPLIVFLLRIKHKNHINLIPVKNDIVIRIGKRNIANMSYLAVYLHFLKYENGHLSLEGSVSYPTGIGKKVSFYVLANGKKIDLKMEDLGLDLRMGVNVYETRTAYRAEIELFKKTEIAFFNEIDGVPVEYGRINTMRFCPVADCIKYQYYAAEGWMFYINGRRVVCEKVPDEEVEKREQAFREQLRLYRPQKAEWAAGLRREYDRIRRQHHNPIWVFMDRPDCADDNAAVLFKYVQRFKFIESYFVIAESSKDYENMKQYGTVVPLYSERHYQLALTADYVISSQCNGVVENPFWEDAEMFRDLYHRPKMIFLQHGVIKDDMSLTLNRFHTNFTGFVTSTEAEYESILRYPYHYTEKEVWLTGLARFDELYQAEGKYILIMPSWRGGLMKQVWDESFRNMRWEAKEGFEHSEFYRRYTSFLADRKIAAACKEKGCRMAFMVHPLMRPYVEKMTQGTDCELWNSNVPYRDAFARGCILVTDYSSVAFDFAYLKKPIVYYQFDSETFWETHTYRQGYFDYERDGFGEVCREESELAEVLIRYLENGCVPEKKYRKRMEELYPYSYGACERIYRKIVKSQREGQTWN